jgi:NADPH-dependent ferric siderophore reductase
VETSLIGRVAEMAARVVLREGTVRALEDLGDGFRRVDLDVAGAQWAAGQKVQFRVRGIDFRTYTPFAWSAAGAVSFLVVRHGTGPAAAWVESLQLGQTVQMWGPRSALDLAKVTAPPIFVGDETSFALTAAWANGDRGKVAAQLYEVGAVDGSRAALSRLALGDDATLVVRTAGDVHRDELARRAVALAQAHPGAPIVLTGNVRSIKAVRDALKAAGIASVVKAKAHWDPNRKGLD